MADYSPHTLRRAKPKNSRKRKYTKYLAPADLYDFFVASVVHARERRRISFIKGIGVRVFEVAPQSGDTYATDVVSFFRNWKTGENHYAGKNRVHGANWSSQDVVVRILDKIGPDRKAFDNMKQDQQAALIHDIDMAYTDPRVFLNKEVHDNYILAVDRSFAEEYGGLAGQGPGLAHSGDMFGSNDEYTAYVGNYPLADRSSFLLHKSITGADLGYTAEHGSTFLKFDGEAVLDLPDMDLHTDHNLSGDMSTSGSNPKFARRRKLPSSRLNIGSSDSIRDPVKALYDPFRGSRTLKNEWHHKGRSGLNKRSNVTYAFRHTVRAPDVPGIGEVQNTCSYLSPQSVTHSEKFYHGTGVHDFEEVITSSSVREIAKGFKLNHDGSIASSEIQLRDGTSADDVNNGVYYSPFCLQEMETLSWHLNRYKIAPTPIRYYASLDISPMTVAGAENPADAAGDAMPGFPAGTSTDPSLTWLADVAGSLNGCVSWLGSHNNSVKSVSGTATRPATNSFGVFNDELYSPAIDVSLKPNSTAYGTSTTRNGLPTTFEGNILADNGSIMRRISKLIGDGNSRYSSTSSEATPPCMGTYLPQLGIARLTFTLVNTGDAPMVVDLVSHSAKKDCVVGDLLMSEQQATRKFSLTKNQLDFTPEIYSAYGANYEHVHKTNKSRKTSNHAKLWTDVAFMADTKFLPTSYRTHSKVGSADQVLNLSTMYGTDAAVYGFQNDLEPINGTPVHKVENSTVVDATGNSVAKDFDAYIKNDFKYFKSYGGDDRDTPLPGLSVNFIDNGRYSCQVPANSQKTLTIILPKRSYDAADHLYHGCLNDLSEAITFSVHGVSAPLVAPGLGRSNSASMQHAAGTEYLGQTSAPASYEILCSEEHEILPCYLSQEPDVVRQSSSLEPLKFQSAKKYKTLANGQKSEPIDGAAVGVHSATYVGLDSRTVDGRYALLLGEGDATKKQKTDHGRKALDQGMLNALEATANISGAGSSTVDVNIVSVSSNVSGELPVDIQEIDGNPVSSDGAGAMDVTVANANAIPVAVTNAHVSIHPNTIFSTDASGNINNRSAALPTVYSAATSAGVMSGIGSFDLALAYANIEAAVAVDPTVNVVAVNYGSSSVGYLFKGINCSFA